MSVNEKMTAIADNIRSKTGGTASLSLDDMASGVNEVYEAGKQKEWSDFWDMYQVNGTRVHYENAFYYTYWNEKTFKPKYDITPTNSRNMFGYFSRYHNYNCDLADLLNKCGVKLDTSNATNVVGMFQYSRFYRIPELDLRKATNLESLIRSDYVQTVDKIILNDTGNQYFAIAFMDCKALKNIEFEGVIGQDMDFKSCPLSIASMKNIIEHLKDYSGDSTNAYKHTVTFSSACKSALDAEGNTSPNGNTWRQYASDLGWNC